MKVSVVIPNYNGEELLKINLPKVLKVCSEEKVLEVIVVDDNSADKSLDFLKNLEVKEEILRVLSQEKNKGFSTTVNFGVKNARSEIVYLLNSDAVPREGFITSLINQFKDNDVFAVGSLDESVEKGKIILRGRGIGFWARGFLVHQRGEVDKNSTLWVSGGSGAFRKSIWEEIGGLNELYNPFYWEDIDISYRAQKYGYKVRFEKKSVVLHEHEKGVIKRTYLEEEVKKIAYRNQIIFVWLNASFTIFLKHLFFLPYHFLKSLLLLDFAFLSGFIDALTKLPKIVKFSFRMRRHFKRTDQEIIKIFEDEIINSNPGL